jgi:hypothetical protein
MDFFRDCDHRHPRGVPTCPCEGQAAENPLDGLGFLLLLAAAGTAAYFFFRNRCSPTPMTPDAVGNVTLTQGPVYLLSMPAEAGSTVGLAADALQTAGFTVTKAWNSGQVPDDWPGDDTDPTRLRFELTRGSPLTLPLPAGERLYSAPATCSNLP